MPKSYLKKLTRSEDPYLRQTAARLLAVRRDNVPCEWLAKQAESKNADDRLAAVLAAGFRLTTPPHEDPPKEVPLSYREQSVFFSTKIRYGDEPEKEVDLRKLGPVGAFTFAEYWKAIKPSKEQQQLFDLLMARLKDNEDDVKLQAAYWLSLLRDPRSEAAIAKTGQVVRTSRLVKTPRREVREVWRLLYVEGVKFPIPPETAAIDVEAIYELNPGKLEWEKAVAEKDGVFSFPKTEFPTKHYHYFKIQSSARQPALVKFLCQFPAELWCNGRLAEKTTTKENNEEKVFIADLQPGGNDLVVKSDYFLSRIEFHSPSEAKAVLPEKLGFATLAKRLKEGVGKGETVAPEFLAVDWASEVKKGNVAEGRKLYGSLGCVKCHAITPDQTGGGGPSLFEAGKRFTVPHLVESILLPSKQIAEPFRGTVINTKAGQVVAGLVVQETAKELEMLLPDATRTSIAKDDIEERAFSRISPMPAAIVRTPAELRDLLAYLLSANPLPP